MEEKVYTYDTGEVTVTYDSRRCIHAEECVKGLQSVFNPNKRPWIQPEYATPEEIRDVVHRCPTGALHVKRANTGEEDQAIPARNTISVNPDGPIYFRGNIVVQSQEGDPVLQDSRFALCRCGASGNKPACDNSHKKIDFSASSHIPRAPFSSDRQQEKTGEGETLILKVMKNGPLLVEGSYQIYSTTSQPVNSSKTIALCRCGGSSDKPFCDGTHKEIGFNG
ncbi:CDGSH iron-sulfur domain-containing protein [Halalkalibaculum sp. DA384]|uniref:CDGSH iron-sulfur domain-containing protein n=1 Tax=Halalkalibaculum sp. DA384 TaxID=3373606 RepID=UPI0037546B19